MDALEVVQRSLQAAINAKQADREKLEAHFGKGNVWDTQQLQQDFTVVGFAAPFAIVIRKSDNQKGSLLFQHEPRFYFDFSPV